MSDDLRKIADVAHDGGLVGLTEHECLVWIRRYTLPYWDGSGSIEEARARVLTALEGGERADREAGDVSARHADTSDAHPVAKPLRGGDPQPATPDRAQIDTEALYRSLSRVVIHRILDCERNLAEPLVRDQVVGSLLTDLKRIIDTALAEQEANDA